MSGEISPELVERMAAHLRECASVHDIRPRDEGSRRRWEELQAITALLPNPDDTDLIEAREVAAKVAENDDGLDWARRCRAGKNDDHDEVIIALAAIKRGRALASLQARGEQA